MSEWIYVTERLPPRCEDVLVTNGKEYRVQWWDYDEIWFGIHPIQDVLMWQEIEEAPCRKFEDSEPSGPYVLTSTSGFPPRFIKITRQEAERMDREARARDSGWD